MEVDIERKKDTFIDIGVIGEPGGCMNRSRFQKDLYDLLEYKLN